MSRYRHEIDNARLHILSLWGFIIILSLALAYAFHGWKSAPEKIDVHVPPDLSFGAEMRLGEIPAPNVYSFAFYFWQQLNRWKDDGSRDYPRNLYRYSAFITPKFRAKLERDIEKRGQHGELVGRVRSLHEIAHFEDWRVKQVSNDVWVVTIDAVIEETVAGLEVKNTAVRYPLRVVRYDVDREMNPWGMALDGFAANPEKLKLEENDRSSQ